MNIEDIEGKNVKLSPRSICVKRDDGKTGGMVSGVVNFLNLPANRQVDFFKMLRETGIWDYGLANHVYVDGKTPYYIQDIRKLENLKKVAAYGYEYDREKAEKLEMIAENAAKYMKVLNVRVV